MKKLIIVLMVTSLSEIALSQNIFPTSTSGGVGIGTSQPEHGYLHLAGDGDSSGINLWTNTGSLTSRIWIDSPNKLFHISRGSDPTKGITLDNDGKIGIGTTSPSTLLEVKGTGEQWVYINQETVGGLRIGSSDGGKLNVLYRDRATDIVTLRSGHDSGELAFIAGGSSSERMRINSVGKIGIGTNNPEHGMLQIYGDGPSEGLTIWTDQGELTSRIWTDVANEFLHISRGNNPINGLTLDNDGNLSIGTTDNGTHKLAVEGTIGAREIKVEASGWSDFVFENDYVLLTLEEVEEHINENGHLPEIPNEQEVTENGINLGEMNAKLLQKIEELTLYMIEQNKELKEAKIEIQELRKEVSALKNE